MGEPSPLIDWRMRAAAGVGATIACAALLALLLLASRTFVASEQRVVGVEVLLTERVREEPNEPRARPRTPGAPNTPAAQAPPARPTVDAAMMSRMLRCVRRPGQPRPPECPQEPAPDDWRRPQLPVGGVYAQPERPDLDRIYTRAERDTLVMPSCVRDGASGACVPFGTRPPPPSRSPEQICRDANLGGPCAPPPERPAP